MVVMLVNGLMFTTQENPQSERHEIFASRSTKYNACHETCISRHEIDSVAHAIKSSSGLGPGKVTPDIWARIFSHLQQFRVGLRCLWIYVVQLSRRCCK